MNGNNLASQCIVRTFKNLIFKHDVWNSLTFDWGIPRPVGRDKIQVWEKWDPRGCIPLLLSSKLTTPHVGVSSYLQNTHLFLGNVNLVFHSTFKAHICTFWVKMAHPWCSLVLWFCQSFDVLLLNCDSCCCCCRFIFHLLSPPLLRLRFSAVDISFWFLPQGAR